MASSSKNDLFMPIQYVKGIGPARAERFSHLGLNRVVDLLFNFPRDYEDTTDLRSVAELEEKVNSSVFGTIYEVDSRTTGNGRSMVGILVDDGNQLMRAIWFNQPFRRDSLRVGQKVLVSGLPKRSGLTWEMVHPRIRHIENEQENPSGEILPVYRLTEGVSQHEVRTVTASAINEYGGILDEVFSADILESKQLLPIHYALQQIHKPQDRKRLEEARNRFVYQELFVLQLALNLRRQRMISRQAAPEIKTDARIKARITRLFPFELTPCQRRAFEEISADMAKKQPMNRLLHGDVGSGKTVVALSAMLSTVANGYQATIMAPTEILANQHFRTFTKILAGSRVRIGLLTGSIPASKRKEILTNLSEGKIDFLIGTQSILNKEVEFQRLGLVIIDEQHRFGVRQRATLRDSGIDPHYLVMTATPIPRSMAMTQFGDLDVSTIKTMPANRQPVHTYIGKPEQRGKWWDFVREKLREGRQAYVVTPVISQSSGKGNDVENPKEIALQSESKELASVIATYKELSGYELRDFKVGLLHGAMPAKEKNQTMEEFSSGQLQVLVTTSVIEVGIDVPNATVMTIESAERFGLAQLHQFRGRVTRGKYAGFVCVFANAQTDSSTARLEAFAQTQDGFELAETDFELRGPGDLFGTRQHGLPPLRIADLKRDVEILKQSRDDAKSLLVNDPELLQPEHERLRRMMLNRYSTALELSDVG